MTRGKVKKLVYGEHAQTKFALLQSHGFPGSRKQVSETIRNPDKVEEGYRGRKVAQRRITETHVLRVIYEEGPHQIKIVTFYPGRKDRYESTL